MQIQHQQNLLPQLAIALRLMASLPAALFSGRRDRPNGTGLALTIHRT
jgi:hypothetical protein